MDFKLPDVGEGIAEGTLVKWLVKEGDTIKVDQDICEIETDKAVVDIPTPTAGVVAKLHWKDGDMVPVGQVLLTITEGVNNSETASTPVEPKQEEIKPAASSNEFGSTNSEDKKPFFSVHKEAATVEPQQSTPATVQTNQTSSSNSVRQVIASPATRKLASEKEIDLTIVKGSGPQGRILQQDVLDGTPSVPNSNEETVTQQPQTAQVNEPVVQVTAQETIINTSKPVLAAPSTRRLARELGIDIRQVKGSGPAGRVTEGDLQQFSKHPKQAQQTTQASTTTNTTILQKTEQAETSLAKQILTYGEGQRVPLSGVRKAIAKHLSSAVHTMAQAAHIETIDVQTLFELREIEKVRAKEMGVKLTYLPFFLKAIVGALREYPRFNASIDEKTQELIMHSVVNIGIAVDTPDGLLVPVINDVAHKSILSLATEITDVATRTRDRKVKPTELQGSTISLSNVGVLGGDSFIPIVNYPNVAIVGIAKMKDSVVVHQGEAVITKTLNLCLSYDHRVVDGADAARFVNAIKERIEDPGYLLLEQ